MHEGHYSSMRLIYQLEREIYELEAATTPWQVILHNYFDIRTETDERELYCFRRGWRLTSGT